MILAKEMKWWKEDVMYQIYPRSFKDSSGDGVGDLRGIIQKIDHLIQLGIDIIWLGPVYDSPNDDNGYDIRDYRKIHEDFGTMDDFKELVDLLHSKGIKLIMDLVVNHSSDEHYWFKESKKSKDNPYRDYYYWEDGKEGGPPNNFMSFFGGSAWEKTKETDQYYLHLFTKKQPDLNWENPKVRIEVYDIMRFWLDKGIDGFRMDVISLISKRLPFGQGEVDDFNKIVQNEYANGPRIHEYLKEMHREVLSHYDIMTVGEGPGITKEIANDYIGNSREELNMIFQLELMFIDFGPKGKYDYRPFKISQLKKILMDWDRALAKDGWNNIFFDNHDFARLVSRFGNDGENRIKCAQLFAMLLLTFRGTPCIYQGSEIGMTNVRFPDLSYYRDVETLNMHEVFVGEGKMTSEEFLGVVHKVGRDNVRTPMQWDTTNNSGFTTGEPWININPNYMEINVELDNKSEDSIMDFYRRLIKLRKNNLALIYGDLNELSGEQESVFTYERIFDYTEHLIVLNISDYEQEFEIIRDLNHYTRFISNYGTSKKSGGSNVHILRPWEAILFVRNKS